MSQAVKAPYPQLGKALGDAIGDVSQKELADFCRVHASDISHALKGKRSLPLAALERAAKRLQLDLTLLIQLKTADELRAAGLIVEAEKVQRLASGLTSSQERLFTPESFFQNWRHTLAIENIIAADRREKRPISYADCL
ncbi:MAG TPA: helix-turn-helix transcriptional regulator, partial [Polyangiaceae bacterium]|nr:helix-turn-helix transcriptional regulator [Polyangiaceae bacterium]